MNMALLAADLSLGGGPATTSVKESGSVVVRHRSEKQHLLYPLSSCDLHALEVYHKALEDERLKIQAFQRELPFCMQLLEDAIEASREQLEERLACKLNTPLHEPQIAAAAATQEFVCNYTSSLSSHRSSLPALGEINLRFKRKWTSMPSSSTHDHHRPYNHAASAHTTKWLLPQNTKLLQNEDSPITIQGSIKLQEFSIPERALPAIADQPPQKTISQIVGWDPDTKSIALNCAINATPTHAIHFHNAKQALYSSASHPHIQADKHMASKMQDSPVVDDLEGQCFTSAMPMRSINDVASLDVPSTYSRQLSLANLSPKDLQISNTMCGSPLLTKMGSPANNTAIQSGGVQRKPRRCWSPELHQRFLSALNHLGGCQVATPKQIRELMNVEGLTNDEVKSHLQKFRLHMRRPNALLANSQGDSPQAGTAGHHLVVFGHIWVPPEYADQHNQHAANANIDIISSEMSAGNGSNMELVKSFRNSCGSNLNSIEHVHGLAGSVQCGSDIAQAGQMHVSQEDYCNDQEQVMHEGKALHEIQLLGERKEISMERNATSPTDAESELCSRQQQSGGCDAAGNHHRINALCAMKERLQSRLVDQVNHDQYAAAEQLVVSRKDEAGKLHLHAGAGKDEDACLSQIVPEYEQGACKKTKDTGTDEVSGKQLLQLHADDKTSMDDH